MKFIVSVVILALAVYSEAGYLPAAVDLSHGAWGAPWGAAAHWGAAAWPAAHWGGPWGHGGSYSGNPWGPSLATSHSWAAPAWGAYGPSAAYHADPLAHGHEGKYVAATRGATHVAPLIGHVQSVSSTNLQPAPGTNY